MSRKNIATILLAIGGLLTVTAFLMAFLWAPMTDFGTTRIPLDLSKSTVRDAVVALRLDPASTKVTPALDTPLVVGLPVTIAGSAITVAPKGKLNPAGIEVPTPDIAQKIFYFHVPVAEASFLVFFFVAMYGGMFLWKKDRIYDTKARIAAEVTFMFIILTMVSGDLWTKASWDSWWIWEPRLTTYFIMTLLVVAYFVLRNSIEDEERRATYASVFGIIAFLDAPLSFSITRWYRSIHPVVIGGASGTWLVGSRLVTFIVAQLGMLMLGYAIYQLRMREELAKERIEAAKAELEG